jgi:hypothetical protein
MINESKRMVQLWFSVNHAVSLGFNVIIVLVIWAAKLKRHPVLLSVSRTPIPPRQPRSRSAG